MRTSQDSDPIVSFGVSYSVAAVVIAVINALTVLVPGLEERAEETIAPAWLYMGLLGLAVFAVFGFARPGRRLGRSKAAIVVIASTVLGGFVILGAAARAGLTGSM